MVSHRLMLLALVIICLAGALGCSEDDIGDDDDLGGLPNADDDTAVDDDTLGDDDDDDDDDDDNDNDNDDDNDDDDTTPPLDCDEALSLYYDCGGFVLGGDDILGESEAIAACESLTYHDQATWSCIVDCAEQLDQDCANYGELMVCVPLCLFHQGPVPEDCTPAYPTVRVCGHRGAALYAPENTIPSFEAALSQGAAFVEVDVRVTADEQLVCMHDDTVDRTTNGVGAVEDFTLAQIKALEIDDSNHNDNFPGLRVPTFAEAMAAIDAGGGLVDIDTKTDRVDLVVAAVHDAGMIDKVMAYCGSLGEVEAFLAEDEDFPVMPAPSNAEEVAYYVDNYDASYIEIESGFFDPDSIAAIHADGALVFQDALGLGDLLFFLGSFDGWHQQLTAGVDIIQTDVPHALVAFIDAVCE